MRPITNYLLNLNVFKPSPESGETENEHQRRTNIIATRVYLVVLTTALIMIALYSWLNILTTLVTLQHPTKEQFEALPLDAQCPCSRISVSYGEFTSIQPTFHQVCSSDFVSDRWTKVLLSGSIPNYNYPKPGDFRHIGSAQFQALAGFCRLSELNFQQSIALFNTSTLLSLQVLSQTALQSQTNASIYQFQLTAPNAFKTQLRQVRELTLANQLLSGLQTNGVLQMRPISYQYPIYRSKINYTLADGDVCDCDTDINCVMPSVIYTHQSGGWVSAMNISGFSSGCMPVTSILSSNLNCFYNQACVNELMSFFSTTEKFTAMTALMRSRFESNSTLESIIGLLMVEEWMTNVSYEKYYSQCAPVSCTYSKMNRHDLVLVLTKLISVLSGLTMGLGLVIPMAIGFLRKPRNREPTAPIPLHIRLRQLKEVIKKVLLELNTFKHDSSNERQMQYQRNATRLYVVLIVSSLAILIVYLSLTKQTYRGTVLNPTQSQYIRLQEIYPDSLSCPCTLISMNYSTFIAMQPHYHQMCSSDLLSLVWISYTGQITISDVHRVGDYRIHAKAQFLLLSTFCQLARQTIEDALTTFLQTIFVSSQVIPQQFFESQVNASIQDWQSTTLNLFVRTINLFQAIIRANQLTNGYSDVAPETYMTAREAIMKPQTYYNCSCDLFHSCQIPMFIYDLRLADVDCGSGRLDPSSDTCGSYANFFYHPANFFASCFPVDALFASTLECFYSVSCVRAIDHYMYSSINSWLNFSILDSTRNSPYETVGQIVNNLTLDSLSSNISFTSYYNACAPSSCIYQYESGNDLAFIAITIIGVFSGLSLGLKILILLALQLAEKMMNGISRFTAINLLKNLFSCHDERQITNRLQVMLITATLVVLYIFSAFTPESKSVKVESPSLFTYKDLTTRFSDSLHCPCSKIAIQYQSFLTVVPRFHQICSSEFVSDPWITYLYDDGNLTYRYAPTDFRYSAANQFQFLATLCQLSRQTVSDSLLQLASSTFINNELLSSSLLHERIATIINQVQVTMPNVFLRTLSLIRETTGANMIISTLSTNWVIVTTLEAVDPIAVETIPVVYEGCSCGFSSKCIQSSRGMMAGCYPVEALFQSPLQCLYDQQCIEPTNTFKAMSRSNLTASSLGTNTTIESIANQLMIEEYPRNLSYEKYFEQCTPSSCTYTYIDKSNIIEGISNLVALYGGLMIICRLVAMTIVRLLRYRRRKISSTTS